MGKTSPTIAKLPRSRQAAAPERVAVRGAAVLSYFPGLLRAGAYGVVLADSVARPGS